MSLSMGSSHPPPDRHQPGARHLRGHPGLDVADDLLSACVNLILGLEQAPALGIALPFQRLDVLLGGQLGFK